MSNTNRLLDMLKSAANPPSSPSQPPSNSSPSHNHTPTSTLSPPAASSSPREPSPAPPPPSLQAVTLQDLFASISSPPVASVTAQANPTSPSKDTPHHQANLLGMLKGAPREGSPAAPPHIAPATDSPAPGREQRLSGSSTPASYPTVGNNVGTPQNDHKVNLLSMFKSPPINGAATTQPVIPHPSAAAPAPQAAAVAPVQPTEPIATPGIKQAKQETSTPAVPTPPSNVASPATKSMFDFVSPFDIFDKPKPKPKAVENQAGQVGKKSPSPARGSAGSSPAVHSASPPVVTPPPKVQPPTQPAVPQQVQQVQGEVGQRQISSASSASQAAKDLGLPYLVNKLVEKGTEGQGPKGTGASISIDLSKPNVDSLINAPGTTQITPITILRAEQVGFSKGRAVAINEHWMAYAISKGRVRLIDSTSGSRLLLQLPSNSGQAVDIAATSNRVAVVGPDRSVTVFGVPTSWSEDDPAHEIVFHIPATPSDEDGIGRVERIEWVRKDGGQALAIGGDQGVIVVKEDEIKDEREPELAFLERKYRVLKTEGSLAAFCLNQTHQAIALLSTKGWLTLYSLANLQRVWNRQLPSSAQKPGTPTSVNFVESNILVGRNDNTQFDLVQITLGPVVLSTIKLVSPSSLPAHQNFAQVVYDSSRNTLWVAPFPRGSIFAFRYTLKNVPPAKLSEKDKVTVVAFDKVAEYPIDPVLTIVLNGKSSTGSDPEFLFATPHGFSMANIDSATTEAFSKPDPSAPSGQSAPMPKAEKKQDAKKGAAKASPVPPAKVVPPVEAPKSEAGEPVESKERAVEAVPSSVAPGDFEVLLKKSEARIIEQVKTALGGVSSLSDGQIAGDIASRVERSLKSTIQSTIQGEVKRSLLPSITSTIQSEVKAALQASVPAAVSSALQSAPKDLERGITPVVQRTVATVLQSSVDRALQDGLQSSVLPAVHAAAGRVADQLSSDFKSEMVQVRKDFETPRHDVSGTESLIKGLAASVADLQRQVASLSEQLHRQQVPQAPAPVSVAPPPTRSVPQHVSAPASIPRGVPPNIEDIFFAALGAQSTPATLSLVHEYGPMIDSIVPNPPGRSLLSQAVLLTLLHRISLALAEIHIADPGFGQSINWALKAAIILDKRNADIESFYPRVIPIVQNTLQGVLSNIPTGPGSSFIEGNAASGIKSVLDVLAQK